MLNKLMEALKNNPENIFFSGADEKDLQKLESNLGVKLPVSFRDFLLQSNGAILFEVEEIFGTRDEDDSRISVKSAKEQIRPSLPDNLIPFHSGSTSFCFNVDEEIDGEYSIVRWMHDGTMKRDDSKSFADWLENYLLKIYQNS